MHQSLEFSVSHQGLPAETARQYLDRRRFTWWTIAYSVLEGRRLGPRRAADMEDYSVDVYDRRLLFVAAATMFLSAMDAFLTLISLDRGAVEINFLMAALISDGTFSFVGWKLVLTAVGLMLLMILNHIRVFGFKGRSLVHAFFAAYVTLVCHQLLNLL